MILKILKEYTRRVIRNYEIYAVSILGMGIAIIASFYIYLFAFKEINTDSFHSKRKDIYRLVNKADDSNFRRTGTFMPLAPVLKEKLPQVANYVRVSKISLQLDTNKGEQTELVYCSIIDPSFFELFNFSLKQGSLESFKDEPNGVVLSKKKALSLFGKENPMGQPLKIISNFGDGDSKTTLQVVGILDDIPENSTIQGDVFISMHSYDGLKSNRATEFEWMNRDTDLYVYAPKLRDVDELSSAITNTLMPILRSNASVYAVDPDYFKINDHGYDLQRMDDIYFDSMDIPDQEKKGDFQFVRILILVGLLTLFMATTNYIIMNLGLNMNRAKEFKVRRLLGATKVNVFVQLMTESLCNAMLCFAITLISYPIIGDFIGNLIGFDYRLSFTRDSTLLFSFMSIILLVGLVIGALEYALSYKTIFVVQKHKGINTGNSWKTKKVMIGFQLTLFIGLMTCILFVGKQVNYMQDKSLGYNPKEVIGIRTAGFNTELKNELLAKSYVKGVSTGRNLFRPTFKLEETEIVDTEISIGAMMCVGDADYLNVHGMELVLGKNLNPSKLPNQKNFYSGEWRRNRKFFEVLVNEEFVKKAALKNPIGTVLKNLITGINAHIVGVFKNVNNTPLYYPVQPTILGFDFSIGYPYSLQVSCDEAHQKKLISEIKSFFIKKQLPNLFLEVAFTTFDYKDIYKKELQLKNLLQVFTAIVLFISLLGLIAISLFIAESRTKEIGIRKVNGATVKEILAMLNKDYIKWIMIAFCIATPIVWYIMSNWLQNFSYKTTLSWWVFVMSGGTVLLLALVTVSWQSIRVARSNPIKSLRTE